MFAYIKCETKMHQPKLHGQKGDAPQIFDVTIYVCLLKA